RRRLWKLMDQCLQLTSNSAIHIWQRRSEIGHRESNKQRMPMQEKRSIALGAARSQLRRIGVPLDRSLPFEDALRVLDDLHRPELFHQTRTHYLPTIVPGEKACIYDADEWQKYNGRRGIVTQYSYFTGLHSIALEGKRGTHEGLFLGREIMKSRR